MYSVIGRASVDKRLEAAPEGRVEGGYSTSYERLQALQIARGIWGHHTTGALRCLIMDMDGITDGAFRAWRASSTGALRCLDGHRRQGLYAH